MIRRSTARGTVALAVALGLASCGGSATADDAADADVSADADATADANTDAGAEPPMSEATFTALDGDLPNPERGFYHYIELLDAGEDLAGTHDDGLRLVYAGVRLDDWADADLPDSLLAGIAAGLARVRAAGLKVVLRFQYNDGPIGTPDASLARIEGHLAQLAPVLADNADVIALLQAGLIGTWGEWHDSTNGLDTAANRSAVLHAVLAALPAGRMTAIRTPFFKEEIFPGGPLTAAEAFTGADAARVGQHNDCFLASDDDEGTYPDPIDTWKDYVAQEGRFTPVGGETCGVDPPRSECASALAELQRLHFSYLNADYHPDVLASWISGGCMDEIRAHLGYRFVLSSASWTTRVRPGGLLHLRVALDNVGYAAPFNARPLRVVLSDLVQRWLAEPPGEDVRRWEPGAPIVLDWRLRVPDDAPPGTTYVLGLVLPDPAPALANRPDYAVGLANQGVWDPSSETNVLTTVLEIADGGDSAPGPETAAFVAP